MLLVSWGTRPTAGLPTARCLVPSVSAFWLLELLQCAPLRCFGRRGASCILYAKVITLLDSAGIPGNFLAVGRR